MNSSKRYETFISYSRRDKDFALTFAREMKSAGFSVWLDQLDIPTGARWDDEVESALRECKIFLIILTSASVSSENVKDEIGYAIDHGKRIMPVLLEECVIPLRLRRFQYIDFTKIEFGEGIKRAKQLLENLLNEQVVPERRVNPDYKPRKSPEPEAILDAPLPNKNKPFQRRWMGIATLIFACIACIGVLTAFFLLKDSIFLSSATEATGCVVTIDNSLVSLMSEPDLFSQQLIRVKPGRYPTLGYTEINQQESWFQIEAEGRTGWIANDTWTIAGKTPSCP